MMNILNISIMKKAILIFSFLYVFIPSGFSTHLMGGEIIAQHHGGNDYVILLTLYRDTLGVPMQTTQLLDISDANGNYISSITCSLAPTANHPIYGFLQGSLLPFYPYGIEIYFFTATVTFPGSNNSEYTISWDNCCRNGAIQNLPNPLNNDMHLFTTVSICGSQHNSTPYFLVKPVIFLPVNTPWQYNPLPYDPDGDSLYWYLDVPHESNGTPSGIPINGYTDPPSDPSNVFSIDPVTGTISWTATVLGNWVYTVICEEYRNGIKIGEIRRDMQFIVLPSGGLPKFSNLGTVPLVNGYPQWAINAGQNFELRLLANDPDPNDSVFFEAYGEPFLLSNPPIFFQESTVNSNEIAAVITWAPTSAEVRSNPYPVVLRLMDGVYMFDETIFIKVSSPLSIENNKASISGNIYPNPSNGLLYIPLDLTDNGDVEFSIFNQYGQVVKKEISYFNYGAHIAVLPTDLSSGLYYVTIMQGTDHIGLQEVIIIK
jgi:hypothetical protein